MTDQLGTLLRRLRMQSGLTQEQVAERSGVSVRTIRRLETGQSTDHRLKTVNLLADALEVGPEDRQRLAATLARAQSAPAAAPSEPAPTPPEPVAAPVPAAPLPSAGDPLADAARELAKEVGRRWQREEEQRRIHDPFPLPVRWREAPAELTDHQENIQRLGPGVTSHPVDLSGDLHTVAEVYRRIPSGRLVILGRAGSGKSILTIRFVLDLLAARPLPGRAPVIFSLGSWDPTTTALRDWLIDHLLRDQLLAGFVPALYRRRVPERTSTGHRGGPRRRRTWDPESAQRWLAFLAHHLVRLERERQDLAWWQISDSLPPLTRVMAVVAASALCVSLSDWLIGLLVLGVRPGGALLEGALMGPVAGLAFGSVYAIITAVGGAVFEPTRVRLRLPGTHDSIGRGPVRAFTSRFGVVLLGGTVMGAGCGLALTLERGLSFGIPLTNGAVIQGTLINMLVFGLVFGLAAGLVFGLVAALEAPVDVTSAATPTGLLASNRSTVGRQVLVLVPALTVAIALGGHLVVGLLRGLLGPMSWTLADGLFIGATGGLGGGLSYAFGFTAWGQWIVLSRVWLPLTGKLPWNTVAFLDDAYQRGVLRQTGAVYQFRHIRLQHHLGHVFRQQYPNYTPARFTTMR